MKILELIKKLKEINKEHGDLNIYIDSYEIDEINVENYEDEEEKICEISSNNYSALDW